MTRRRAAAAVACAAVLAMGGCARTPARDPFVASFAAIRPAVVLFTMRIPSDDRKRAKRGDMDDAYGTGIVVRSNATSSRILTAEHVVEDARRLRATLDERRVVPARVLATDRDRDLALVAIDVGNRPVARLGSSRSLEPGLAIGVAGYPVPDEFEDEKLGLRTSVFGGRLASVREDALELDLPIIPGESGGPIFDARTGDVIGLADSRFDDERSVGFGIPIDDATAFLRAHGGG